MWHHASTNDDINIMGPTQEICIFCRTGMMMEVIENKWQIDEDKIKTEHEVTTKENIKYVDGIFSSHLTITHICHPDDAAFYCCPVCGWWCIIQEVQYDTPKMPYMAFQWAAGALISQNFPDISAPLSEVRCFLAAQYDQRFLIDPYRLEDVVASIFRSFKCHVHISSRSHDGGLDIFGLDPRGQQFGVQVKRYRRKIGVEQLREFVGALTLHGILRGIFVTTSSFTSGVPKLRGQAQISGIQLKCADATKLFDMLKAAQIRDFAPSGLKDLALTHTASVSSLNYGGAFHMNSL
ncbi:hypothetical protein BVZ28_10225 [Alcaligenes faecalis]|uniref:restriction endonuclease n=1 Tax=Alcaligenes faecalis TaxID=511 RepID=UPI000A2DD9FE|nr:restriction endonuclease [Alcaligenes faecalis]KAA1286410.1 restriction endonuclease [Alcaligenes faecalis]OSZ34363.1 hypothetical protein BVZ28_10225 [Alcaligenes faecalis]OSZ44931.1 hypothetical protein BVZ29_06765 [Alcaligenes faecalis]